MKRIKRTAVLLLVFSFIIMSALSGKASEGVNASVSEGDVLSGTQNICYYSSASPSIALDGALLDCEDANSFIFTLKAQGVDYTNGSFYAGSSCIGTLADISNGYTVPPLTESETLTVRFIPSVGAQLLSVGSQIYGEYNIDDITLSSFSLALPSGVSIKPSSVSAYYPVVGSAETTTKTLNVDSIAIGDGWDSATGLGGSTPNTAIACDFIFDIPQSEGSRICARIDTTQYADGAHILTFSDSDTTSETSVIFDNTAPVIDCPLPFNSVIDGESALEYSASDEYGKITLTAKIGTEKYIKGRAVKLFCTGSGAQTLVITAKDQAGNVSVFSTQFYLSVASGIDIVHGTVTPTDEAYAVNELQAEVSGQNGTSYSFTVSVPDSAKRIFVRYKASVTTGERTLVSIYNTLSGEYEDVALVCSGEETVIDCALENRAADEKVLFKAEPYVCMGESDTLVWITDTQYYTRYDDLLDEYLSMSAYAASLYMDKKASYLIHSGDIADDYSPLSEAYRQLENALIAHEPFTALGMPFGIVAGNHDVGQAVANFSPFCKYFGASDFDGTSYYGASLDDNVCHYDLVSLGLYDFLFLYIGYYVEADPVVVTWTNAVLANYPDRNAVIVTHSYLDSDGDWLINSENTTDYTHSRAEKIWEDIVVPNENVVAVFCGHVHGAARNLRSVGDTGRQVWEILSDYQFADTQAPTYIVNSMPCDGEGYLRLVSFADGKMTQTTYSPFLDDYNYFSDDSDSFTVDITLSQVRFGMTVDRFEAYVPTQALTSGQAYSGSAVVLSGDYTLSEESQAEDEGRASNMIWIAAAIIAAAAAIASVFYTNRKHHKEMLH